MEQERMDEARILFNNKDLSSWIYSRQKMSAHSKNDC